MYLGIDIGGTKTFVASLNDEGVIQEMYKFPTPKTYSDFLKQLAVNVAKLSTKEFACAGAGVPGKLDRQHGIAIAFGNRPWHNVHIRKDINDVVHCEVIIDNDANLAGLSEAMLLKDYHRVLYVTISTGIGTGFIVDQRIDPGLADSEGGSISLEHDGKLMKWEQFASGKAIVAQFGKRASEITETKTWRIIAHNIAVGLIDLIAVAQPEVIVLGGGVGAHYEKFAPFLNEYLASYDNPLVDLPLIRKAARPELAVIYGCYDIARNR